MIEIDGSYLEGGGQIIRTALALSTLTGKPFKAVNIRKGRSKPGLKAQHVKAIESLQLLSGADVKGNYIGSLELEYWPKELNFHNLNIDIETAGSITLLLQAILPVVVFSDKKLIIKVRGGTDTKHSMPIDYFINVLLPHLKRYAVFEPILEKRGYYPKGNGRFVLKINPIINNKPFNLFQEQIVAIKGISHASKDLMKANVAERQAKSARYHLGISKIPVNIAVSYSDTDSTGSGITLWALSKNNLLGSSSLGERGKPAEKVGEEAAISLLKEIKSGCGADKYLCDQLIPFLAFSGGKIKASEITDHCMTNIYSVEKFLNVKYEVKDKIIECTTPLLQYLQGLSRRIAP